ncbi:MAG: MFS transporter [Desulfobacterales bacterium]|nr:MFS transporter [Desulfobacterales bacterium]
MSIPQVTYFGVFTIIGLITMAGRLTDAVTDPWIATLSDKSRSRRGRQISLMGRSAAPFAILTVLVFRTPAQGVSAVNAVCLSAALLLFYFFMTMYVT